jgi:hypothetical protein
VNPSPLLWEHVINISGYIVGIPFNIAFFAVKEVVLEANGILQPYIGGTYVSSPPVSQQKLQQPLQVPAEQPAKRPDVLMALVRGADNMDVSSVHMDGMAMLQGVQYPENTLHIWQFHAHMCMPSAPGAQIVYAALDPPATEPLLGLPQ